MWEICSNSLQAGKLIDCRRSSLLNCETVMDVLFIDMESPKSMHHNVRYQNEEANHSLNRTRFFIYFLKHVLKVYKSQKLLMKMFLKGSSTAYVNQIKIRKVLCCYSILVKGTIIRLHGTLFVLCTFERSCMTICFPKVSNFNSSVPYKKDLRHIYV